MKNEGMKKVFESLLHEKYQWRTIKGISRQTKLSPDDVKETLDRLIKKEKVRKAHIEDVSGNDLYGLISRVDMDLDL